MAKHASHAAMHSGATFSKHKEELLRLQESQLVHNKHSVWNWIKHKHTVLSLFFVYEQEGLPRPARFYIFLLDIMMNLFLTLEFDYTEHQNQFGPYTQSAITISVCVTVGFIIHYIIYKLNKLKNTSIPKILGFLGLGIVLPLVLLGITAYYVSKIGGLSMAEDVFTQFGINVVIDWCTDLMILFIAYFVIKNWFSSDLDDRNIAEDDIKAGKDAIERAEKLAKEHEAKSQASRVRKIKIQRKLRRKKKVWLKGQK